MPTTSSYADLEIPNTDLWGLIFEDKRRPYPDDKGKQCATQNDQLLSDELAGGVIGSLILHKLLLRPSYCNTIDATLSSGNANKSQYF